MTLSPPPSPGDLHEDQVIALLRSGAHGALLSAYFGDTEYRVLSQLAKLAATRRNRRGRLVFILPGIMGSRLGNSSALLWLHPVAVAQGGLAQLALPASKRLHVLGVMLPGYLKMRLSLEIAGFRPVFHPFDWRADLESLGRALLRSIDKTTGKVAIVAHSMGGLVARIALAHDKGRRIQRLVQLGAPNAGSFAPVQALRAVYPTVRKIASLDRQHTAEELARSVFLTLPGLYQMLPSAQDGELDLFEAANWPSDLAPDAKMLARACKVRGRLPPADARCSAIVGMNQETITSLSLADSNFEYAIRRDGDGTVPLSRALWSGAQTWFADENHGALTNNNAVLDTVVDLLRDGETSRLSAAQPTPSTEVIRRVTDSELRTASLRKIQWDQLSLDSRRRILDPVLTPEFMAP
jgi:pimeloyl-ACP methyl ester carboxylesterase